jgi:hypothetical protein
MLIRRINDPHILNAKVDLEAAREALKYRNRVQTEFKQGFKSSQRTQDGKSKAYHAMIEWNKLYINKLLRDISKFKQILDYLYESERKLLYVGKRREESDQ